MFKTRQNLHGYVLIEALIAMLIVAIGTFGLIRTNTVLLAGSGESKVRSQAVQLAQWQIEGLRNIGKDDVCPTAGSSQVTATSASTSMQAFKIQTVVSTTASASEVNVRVCVAWDNSANACDAPVAQKIEVNSTISCAGTGAAGLASGQGIVNLAGFVKTPTGAARVGGRVITGDLPGTEADRNSISIGGSNFTDGTRSVLTNNKWELIREADGTVLLTIDNATENDRFSTISGRVLIEADNKGDPIVNPLGPSTVIDDDTVFLLSSDASVCTRVFPVDNNTALGVLPINQSGKDIKYHYFYYQCYVGKGWWGNLGVVRLDNANVNDRVCVGDPSYSDDSTLWSRHAQLSSTRGYRAYRLTNEALNTYETIGIGVSTENGTSYTAVNIGADGSDTGLHDFLMTNITGSTASCLDSGKMALTNPSPFLENQGKFYCMSGECPDLNINPTTPNTAITGTIQNISDTSAINISNFDSLNSCSTKSSSGNTFTCQLNWGGTANTTWKGAITFDLNGKSLCASGSTASITPSGTNVAYSINDSGATPSNAIVFTDVPVAVTAITMNLKGADSPAGCGTLGQPAPVWENTTVSGGTSTLTWPEITNANDYDIYTCSAAASLTPCTFGSTKTLTTSNTSYKPAAPSNKQMICIGIIAKSTTLAASVISPTKCVSRDGNTYTHY